MQQQFTPCLGKQACRDGETHCLTCGRSHEEIARTRGLLDELTQFALQCNYSNMDEFANYIARKLVKKIKHQRELESKP